MFGAVAFALRSAFDHLHYPERQREATDVVLGGQRLQGEILRGASLVRLVDTTSMPVDLDLPSRLYRPGELKSIVTVHVTDVDGGFGVAPYQIAKWRRLLERGKVPAELLAQLPDPTDLGGSSFMLALLERYSGVAYHAIASRRIGDIRNHPITLRTSHGDAGNMGAGFAVDCGNTEALPHDLILAGRASLARLVLEVFEATGEIVTIVPHRAWSAARREDPGALVWNAIILHVVAELGPTRCRVGYNTEAGGGLPVPSTWDRSALYDAKGRKLAA